MSDVNFDKYHCCLSLKVLYTYYSSPLENGPITESVVFLREHAVLNVLAFQLAIWGYIHYTTISVTFSCHSIFIFQVIIVMIKEGKAEKI